MDALTAVPDGRHIPVVLFHGSNGSLCTPAHPRDLAVQLLTALDPRLTDDPPAVVTAGTEHRAEKIRGGAIPDEEN